MQLAFAGEPLDDASSSSITTTTSRFGGHASLPSLSCCLPPSQFARCGSCNESDRWLLITQFDAPMENTEARSLFVYACNYASCNGKRGSVRVFRGQKKATRSHGDTTIVVEERPTLESKPTEEELKPKKDNETVNPAPAFGAAPAFGSNEEDDWDSSSPPAFGASAADKAKEPGSNLADDLNTLLTLREEQLKNKAAQDKKATKPSAAPKTMSSYAQAAAASKQPSFTPSSKLPFGFSDSSPSSSEPILPKEDTTIEAQQPGDPSAWFSLPRLPCFTLEWDYEYSSDPEPPLETPVPNIELSENSEEQADFADYGGNLLPEQYEKAVYPKGMSKTFRNFQKTVSKSPEQALRYDGDPLYFSGEVPSSLVSPCPQCGGKRGYEFQVMPSLLYTLKTMAHALAQSQPLQQQDKGKGKGKEKPVNPTTLDTGMEFGTVLVYTCQTSCDGGRKKTEGDWVWFEEQCIVQMEE